MIEVLRNWFRNAWLVGLGPIREVTGDRLIVDSFVNRLAETAFEDGSVPRVFERESPEFRDLVERTVSIYQNLDSSLSPERYFDVIREAVEADAWGSVHGRLFELNYRGRLTRLVIETEGPDKLFVSLLEDKGR